ncbi:MAG: recombinase family protein [Ectobacillus sp.]
MLREIRHVAMYLRISQEKKGEGVETLSNHREILTEYAQEHDYTWEEYGEVLSGGASDLGQRPQLQKLLKEIEKFDAILVFELSRLSRNGLISETVLQYCIDYDKPIITPHYTYDLANNSNDVLTFRFGSLIASQEHSLIGKRSKANKIQMTKAGLHVSGGVPYGYRRNSKTKKLEIYEPEAKAVRLIFKLHGEGLGSRKIVDTLNREGYLPQRSDAWNLPSVKRIIKNKTYKGTVFIQDRKRIKEHGKYIYKVLDTIEVENAHPAIISPDEWDRANQEREERVEKFKITRERPPAQYDTILRDLVFCGKCGRKIAFRRERNGKVTMRPCQFQLPNSAEKCKNSGLLVEYLEKEVVEKLKQYRGELIQELVQLRDNDTSQIELELKERLNNIKGQLETVKKKQANLLDLALEGLFSREELKEKKQQLHDHEHDLQRTLEQLENQLENLDTVPITNRIEHVVSLLDNFETLSVEKQNRVLKRVIKKIYFTREIPEDLRQSSPKNLSRRNYPFEYVIEYF